MNKSPYILGLAVAVSFAGGYGMRFIEKAGANNHADENSEGYSGGRSGGQGNDGFNHRVSDRTAGGFAPLFAKGQAAAWLVAVSKDNWSNDAAVAMKMDQQFGGMDARTAEELALEGMRVWNLNFEDPANQEKYPNPEVADHLAKQAFGRLAQLDPARALELMRHGEDQHFPDELLNIVFGIVAVTDPARANAALASLAPEDVEAATGALVKQWVKQDPRAALALLDQFSPVSSGKPDDGVAQMRGSAAQLRSDILMELAKTHPDLALQSIGEGIAVGGDFGSLVNLSLGDDEMRAKIAAWAEGYSGPEADRIRSGTLRVIAGSDPGAAVDLYMKIGARLPDADRAEAAADIAGQLAVVNRDQASAWADTLPAGPVKEAALAEMVKESLPGTPSGLHAIIRDDVGTVQDSFYSQAEDAARWLAGMAPSSVKDDLTLQWIGKLQEQSGDTAMQWIETLPDGPQKEMLQRQMELKTELRALEAQMKQEASPADGSKDASDEGEGH
jgi:hypothetical protein